MSKDFCIHYPFCFRAKCYLQIVFLFTFNNLLANVQAVIFLFLLCVLHVLYCVTTICYS